MSRHIIFIYYACPDFQISVLCIFLQPTLFFQINALSGYPPIFQSFVEKREQYSLRSNCLVFVKIDFYVYTFKGGSVIWLTVHIESAGVMECPKGFVT